MGKRLIGSAIVVGLLTTAAANAQLLPGIGALPGRITSELLPGSSGAPPIGGVVDTLGVDRIGAGLPPADMLGLRRERLRALIRGNRDALEADDEGNPVRRGEIVAIDPSPALLASAQAAGFSIIRQERIDGLDLAVAILAVRRGDSAHEAITRLRKIAPDGQFEYNHVFEPAGGALVPASMLATAASGSAPPEAIGMIDGGVSAHPALSRAAIEQRGFVAGAPRGSGHGTAIASLLVGEDGAFRGAATGRSLLVADVYGGQPAAGSADAIARAIGWMAARRTPVITISLVGPPDGLIARAVSAALARGIVVVAAVGNDGPAAPALYPASYPGVIAVTGVDAHGRALIEAGRATHLDFAAPGADMTAALPGHGYATVRGTSFAAPLVAARFAANAGSPGARLTAVAGEAQPGRGRVGRGIVCARCRIDPSAVGAKK